MLCHFARRKISRSEDRGKAVPRYVERHMARCVSCREFAGFTDSLKVRLSDQRTVFLAAVPEFPLKAAEGVKVAAGPGERRFFVRRLALHPFPAAVAALVVVAAAVVLFRVVPREPAPTPEDRAAARAALKSIVAAPDGFQGALIEAETSLDKERRILEGSIASAFEYLQARLNIRIERRDSPKPL
jgi:hypothetical protein